MLSQAPERSWLLLVLASAQRLAFRFVESGAYSIKIANETRTSAHRVDFTPTARSSRRLLSLTHEGLSSLRQPYAFEIVRQIASQRRRIDGSHLCGVSFFVATPKTSICSRQKQAW
jgi:hypothetical protein